MQARPAPGSDSGFGIHGFKLTPHIAKETIECDFANRPLQAAVYSERLSTRSTEVRYFYDVTGQMVAVRNLNVATGDTSTVGYAYQGHQQLFSYTLDSDTANHLPASGKITSFNFLGLADEVLAVDSLKGQSVASRQFTAWQFNNLDGGAAGAGVKLGIRDSPRAPRRGQSHN